MFKDRRRRSQRRSSRRRPRERRRRHRRRSSSRGSDSSPRRHRRDSRRSVEVPLFDDERRSSRSSRCPAGSHTPNAIDAQLYDDHAFGCKPFHRPVVSSTGKVCCQPVSSADRVEVADELSSLLREVALEHGANVGGDVYDAADVQLSRDAARRLLLKAYAQVYPADYRNFQFHLDPETGLLTVKAVGSSARRLLDRDRDLRSCRHGEPRASGQGLGHCPLSRGVSRDEIAPGRDECCQRLSSSEQKRIQRTILKSADALANYVDRDPSLERWAHQEREDPFLDELIALLAQWTLVENRRVT